MRTAGVLCLALLALAAVYLLAGSASAAATAATCSQLTVDNGGLGTRLWYAGVGTTAGTACSTLSAPLLEVNSGEGITLRCREATTGTPPGTPTTFRVQGRADTSGTNNAGGTFIWDWQPGACTSEQSHTVHCTSDGSAASAPRYGIVRIFILAQRTTVPTYDANSDQTGNVAGIFRCNPRLTVLTDGNPTTSPSLYVGGETYRSGIAVDSGAYNAGVNAQLTLTCGASAQTVGSIELSTTTQNVDTTLKGSTGLWPSGCLLRQTLALTRTSNINGLETEPYAKWDMSEAPAGTTYDGQQARRDTKILDRTLQISACLASIGAEAGITRAMPGEDVAASCSVTNARGESIAAGQLATSYLRRSTPYSTTDFPSVDVSTALGAVAWSTTARTYATGGPATDTNTTGPLDYLAEVKVFAGARTDGELVAWGSGAGLLDVSTSFNLTVSTWKSTCTGTPTGQFVLASDVLAQTEGPVRDARGNVVTRPLIFNRSWEEPDRNARVPSTGYDAQSGVTSGTSACHTMVPQPPASANWRARVTVVDGRGSTGTAESTLAFLTPYTSPLQLSVMGAAVPSAPCSAKTMQIHVLRRDETTGLLEPTAPDQAPFYWINYTDAAGTWRTALPIASAPPTGLTPYAYHANWTIPCDWPAGRPAVLHAAANISGLYITTRADLLVQQAAGDDPLSLSAADVYVGAAWNVTVAARYDNLTARTGAAANISLRVRAPTGAWIYSGNPTEEIGPEGAEGYYYATGLALSEGTYEVRAIVRTQLGEVRNAPPTSFRALPRPASAAGLDYYGNETLQRANTTLGLLQGDVSATVDATLVTLQDLDRDHSWLSDQHLASERAAADHETRRAHDAQETDRSQATFAAGIRAAAWPPSNIVLAGGALLLGVAVGALLRAKRTSIPNQETRRP